jgi:hypothetical protein
MIAPQPLCQEEFEELLGQHRWLVRLANDLEYQLYRLGETPGPETVRGCQQAGGALIGVLRDVLYRHDQQVLPLVERFLREHP